MSLIINTDVERLYYSLQRGLNKNGLTIYDESFDQARSLAIFYMDEYDANKRTRTHWWNPFSAKRGAESKLSPHTLQEILAAADSDFDTLVGIQPQKTKKLSRPPGYLLVMRPSQNDNEYQLIMRNANGKALTRSENQRLLDIIRRRLY